MAREKAAGGPRAESPAEVDERGRITLTLEGEEFLLRPSREAIATIERRLGLPLYDLTTAASRVGLTQDQLTIIAVEFMRAHGKTMPEDDPRRSSYIGCKEERVGDLIFEASPAKVCARLYILLLGAISGGYDASGEAKAAPLPTA
jgi:hypothetical protein